MINFYRAKTYCKDDISLIENYGKAISDSNKMWDCHHRREMTTPKKELLELGEYFNRPASELIFLTKSEHRALHASLKFKGCKLTEETKKKISDSHKGKIFTKETKRKMSEAHKGKIFTKETKRKISETLKGTQVPEETRRKMSEYRKSGHWFNNGIKNVFAKSCPEGFVRGRLKKKSV